MKEEIMSRSTKNQNNKSKFERIEQKLLCKKTITITEYKYFLNKFNFSNEFKLWLLTSATKSIESFLFENYDLSTQKNLKPYLEKELQIYLALKNSTKEHLKPNYIDLDLIRRERELLLRRIVVSEFDKEKNKFTLNELFFKNKQQLVFSTFDEYYTYIDGDFTNANLLEFDFDDIDISNLNLDKALLNSSTLKKIGKYNDSFFNNYIVPFSNISA